MNVVLQPASGPVPQEHYRRTIENPVDLDEIEHLLPSGIVGRLRARYPEGKAPLWGAVNGNRAQWDKLEDGDLVLFYRQGEFFATARVTEKTADGHHIATHFWKGDGKKGQFDLLFFLENVERARIPWPPIREAMEWSEAAVVQSLTVLNRQQAGRVLPLLGLHGHDEAGTAAAEAAEAAVEHRASGQGFAGSQAAKKAIEMYAMQMAREYYEAREFTVLDRSGNHSFDLECRRGSEHLLVEVKVGLSSPAMRSFSLTTRSNSLRTRTPTWHCSSSTMLMWRRMGVGSSRQEDGVR